MKFVAGRHSCRHVADETFQRAPPAEHAQQNVARIHLRQPARRQLQHVVSRVVRQHPHRNHVTRARRAV